MTRPVVVDASYTYRLLLPGPDQARFYARMTHWLSSSCALHAPTLWVYEMTSALCKAVYSGAITGDEASQLLVQAQRLRIDLIPPSDDLAQRAFLWAVRLRRMSAYDSFYLALAESLDCELWTADQNLVKAAKVPWVRWAGEMPG